MKGLFIDKKDLKIYRGKATLDKTTGSYIPNGPVEDVTNKILSLAMSYLTAVGDSRKEAGLSDTFQLESPKTNYILQIINANNLAEAEILLSENEFLLEEFNPLGQMKENIVLKKSIKKIKEIESKEQKDINVDVNKGISEKNDKEITKEDVASTNTVNENEENILVQKPKRHRRTKAEMEAARLAEQANNKQEDNVQINEKKKIKVIKTSKAEENQQENTEKNIVESVKPKRHRRTKAEMEAARLAGQLLATYD